MMKKQTKKWIFWVPRILSIVFILFLALFSFDVFDSCNSFSSCSLGLLMHNLPSIILAIILIISWKYEIVGAIAFILAGLLYTSLVLRTVLLSQPHPWFMLSWTLTIAGPALLVGILFWIGWRRKRK